MSYDISLVDAVTGETLTTNSAHEIRGGTYAVGGTRELWLNITWNYGHHFRRVMGEGGIRTIYGLSGAASISVLQKAIDGLGDDVDENYWTDTEGNAKRALLSLRAFAELRPDGIWRGD